MSKAGTMRGEKAYQMLKLVHSGRSLAEAKAEMKAVSMGLDKEYVTNQDRKDLLQLDGFIQRVSATRGDLSKLKFAERRPLLANREETAAKFATQYRGKVPLNWSRDGNLVRQGPPNKPRPGSSEGKIERTRVRGAQRTLNDLKNLVSTLRGLQKRHGKGASTKQLQAAFKQVRLEIATARKGG